MYLLVLKIHNSPQTRSSYWITLAYKFSNCIIFSNIQKQSMTVPVFSISLSLKKQTIKEIIISPSNSLLTGRYDVIKTQWAYSMAYPKPTESFWIIFQNPRGRCINQKPQKKHSFTAFSAFPSRNILNFSPQFFDPKPRIIWFNVSPRSSSSLGSGCLLYLFSS